MFKPNKLYRHAQSLGDVDFLCIRAIRTEYYFTVVMRPVHRRLGPYGFEYITTSEITPEQTRNWSEVLSSERHS